MQYNGGFCRFVCCQLYQKVAIWTEILIGGANCQRWGLLVVLELVVVGGLDGLAQGGNLGGRDWAGAQADVAVLGHWDHSEGLAPGVVVEEVDELSRAQFQVHRVSVQNLEDLAAQWAVKDLVVADGVTDYLDDIVVTTVLWSEDQLIVGWGSNNGAVIFLLIEI